MELPLPCRCHNPCRWRASLLSDLTTMAVRPGPSSCTDLWCCGLRFGQFLLRASPCVRNSCMRGGGKARTGSWALRHLHSHQALFSYPSVQLQSRKLLPHTRFPFSFFPNACAGPRTLVSVSWEFNLVFAACTVH